jgi:hypothetical protein
MKAVARSFFRRPFAVVLSIGLLFQAPAALRAEPLQDGMADIVWRAPGRQSITIQKQLDFRGSVIPEQQAQPDVRSPALIYILVGVVSIDLLVKTLMSAYKEVRYGGIVVRRGADGRLQIENDKRLAGGTILVDQGSAREVRVFRSSDKPGSGELVQAITPLLR